MGTTIHIEMEDSLSIIASRAKKASDWADTLRCEQLSQSSIDQIKEDLGVAMYHASCLAIAVELS